MQIVFYLSEWLNGDYSRVYQYVWGLGWNGTDGLRGKFLSYGTSEYIYIGIFRYAFHIKKSKSRNFKEKHISKYQ